jgi:hypothetical protein
MPRSAAGGSPGDQGETMHVNKVIFFVITIFAAIVIAPLVGGAAAVIGALAGMQGPPLVVLFGSATTASFAAILALASLAANLFFKNS